MAVGHRLLPDRAEDMGVMMRNDRKQVFPRPTITKVGNDWRLDVKFLVAVMDQIDEDTFAPDMDGLELALLAVEPMVVKLIEARCTEALDEIEKMRDALKFYADKGNYDDEGAPVHQVWASGEVIRSEDDLGWYAREALKETP